MQNPKAQFLNHVVSLFVDESQSRVPNLQTNGKYKSKRHVAQCTDVHSLATDKIVRKHIYKHHIEGHSFARLFTFKAIFNIL